MKGERAMMSVSLAWVVVGALPSVAGLRPKVHPVIAFCKDPARPVPLILFVLDRVGGL